MARCRYRSIPDGVQCTDEAATAIEAEFSDGSSDSADCCSYHQKLFFEGWSRMQADAARLKARGLVEPHLGRIMVDRVDRGAYETEPTALELSVRALEERFVTARVRFAPARTSGAMSYIDLSFSDRHLYFDVRPNGAAVLAEFGTPWTLEADMTSNAIANMIALWIGS